MSLSIDQESEGEDARGVLASWLDDYISGRCDRADMQASFMSVCRSNPDAPWDALALLDQYQRRGRIDAALARSLKTDIAQLVFGRPNQTETSPQQQFTTTDVTIDNTGSRWRSLLAERSPDSINSEPAFADPSQFRRDDDPPSRPAPAASPKVRDDAPITSAPPAAPSSDILRARYELISILGRGSTGTVYKAIDRHRAHLAPSARCVAVKVLKLDYRERPEALAQLEREFHQAQSLSHPNIVSVFDLDRDGGTYFIVMELLEGELLADILRHLDGRPMARDLALGIITSVGAALAHAHRRDVVHADLKPRNIMITTSGEVRVLDFGFARHRPLDVHGASGLQEISAGAPAYASVERVNGNEPHPSDDVYSLACIAYELLSGRHPFGGRSAVLARAYGRKPQRIPGLTHKQSHALNRALLWARGERKTDVVELLSALDCAGAPNRPILPQELMVPQRQPWRWGRVMAAACLGIILGAAGFFFWRLDWPGLDSLRAVVPPIADRELQSERAPAAAGQDADDTAAVATTAAPPPAVAENPLEAPSLQPRADTSAPPRQSAPATRPAVDVEKPAVASAPAAAGPAVLEFEKDTFVVTEADGAVRVTIRRSGSTTLPVSFSWALRSNSAESGADFASIGPATEQIPAGEREWSLTIPLVQDTQKEGTELFLIELFADGENVKLGERSSAAVIIVDDD